MKNITVHDNGSGFCILVDGLIVDCFNTLGGAWNHIAWMYRVAQQQFTVGKDKIPVKEWIEKGIQFGWLEKDVGMKS